ncbi:Glu-tRNA(Gln) amidotransferase subunit GatE [Candidatus Pacearchaeota archaeon]|nr:Glu-tRNA(Gln) amidotransferase subunit GatE [Candidatus Pacearchaeota archaeon]
MDYKKLQFKSGLEIHQQLDSSKLFCNCISVLRNDEPDFEIKRKLHAVAGEGGEIDIAAKHQAKLDKEFVYQGYNENTCLVELDEEPPHEINKDALKIAIQIGLLMNMKIVPLTQIMRKTVVDGSNTSGFQRTVLIAMKGYLETSKGKVGIESLLLEEDSARIVKREEKREIYRLDRLGIPLVEIVTAPDIKDAEHAKEVALQIGNILRSCKVKRGIGTIRQDVNISIKGENRVEIKGMQNMNVFIKAINNEVERQKKLSDSKKPTEMEVRNVLPDASSKFMRPLPGSARMYPETDLPLLKISRNLINEAKKDLPKLKKDVEKDLDKLGLNKDMIKLLFKQNKFEEFKSLLKIINKPVLVAKILLMYPREIAARSEKNLEEVEKILDAHFDSVLQNVKKGKISEGHIKSVLENIVKGEKFEIPDIDFSKAEEKIIKIIKDKPGLSDKAYMGLVMKEFKGKIGGREAMEIIQKHLK